MKLAIIAALISVICIVKNRDSKTVAVLKYVSATAVGLTFLTVAEFLGPLYGHSHMYHGANLFFHLIIPLFAIIEFVLLNEHKMGIKENLYTMLPPLLYGMGYLINILINGAEENDFYAFTAWGLPIGIVIKAIECFVYSRRQVRSSPAFITFLSNSFVISFVLLHGLPDQVQNLPVYGASLVLG